MFKKFITKDNPLYTLSFGLCLLLIGSSSFELALGLGVLMTLVWFLSSLVLKLVEPLIIDSLKSIVYLMITTTIFMVLNMFIKAYIGSFFQSVELYLPLMIIMCWTLNLNNLEPLNSLKGGLKFTFVISILGLVRELLTNMSLVIHHPVNSSETLLEFTLSSLQAYKLAFFQTPIGALVVLALLIAIVNKGGHSNGNN